MFQVPFLVTDDEISRPILGYNTIEYLVTNFKDSVDLPQSMVQMFGGLAPENGEAMVNLVESAGKIAELSQEARLNRRYVIHPGSVQKVRCKVTGWDICNPYGKIIMFSPFEKLCVEK